METTEKRLAKLEEKLGWYASVVSSVKGTPREFVDIKYLKEVEAVLSKVGNYLQYCLELNSLTQ